MNAIPRDLSTRFIDWIASPGGVIEILKSDVVANEYPNISWSKLQLLIIDWADQQCSAAIQSGLSNSFADISFLFRQFSKHWNKHKLDFFAVYPAARDQWSDEHREHLPLCLFEVLLEDLTGSNDRTDATMIRPYDRQRIRSNAYELSHYLIMLRQRMNANAPITEQPRLSHMLKVHSRERKRPKRNVDFCKEISDYLLDIRFSVLTSNDWAVIQEQMGRDWLLEVWGDFLSRIGIKNIAPFQLKCFRALLDSALLEDSCTDPIMITAGTGFGKTEAFLFPILFYSTINLLRHRHNSYGPDAILVYPRIDLCNNQLERYLWYAHCLKEAVVNSPRTIDILDYQSDKIFGAVLGHSGAKPDDSDEPFKIECPICKAVNQEGFIKLQKQQRGRFEKKIPYCTKDQTHQVGDLLIPELTEWYAGRFTVAISTSDTLHRRLMDKHGRKTLWKKPNFLPRFIVLDEIHIYEGQTGSHIANLARRLKVYLKNIGSLDSKEANLYPPIFVGASATIGNPQKVGSDIFGVSNSNMNQRVLKPIDEEMESLGREYTYILKTPPIREIQDIRNGLVRSRVVSEQASLLQALMAFWHAMRKTLKSQRNLAKYRLLTFVDSIDSVWRITQNLDDAEMAKRLYQFRVPRGRWENLSINGNDNCPKFLCSEICESPPHQFFDKCLIYQQGECWWSMGISPDEFLNPMRVVGRISGFTRVPQNFPRDQNHDQWDCMVATSTLEVGFDHSELIATAQFKAPPNPASFQQRKGRGGRGIEDIPLTLMVLGNSPGDLFAFKHEQRYFEPTSNDLKIHFDAQNQFIRNQHAMSAVYDFLSWSNIIIFSDEIYKKCDIQTALGYLNDNREDFNNWMVDLYSSDGLSRNECIRIADQCLNQMKKSVVNLNHDIPGIYNSLDLFRYKNIPPDWRIRLQYKISEGNGNSIDVKTLVILEVAEAWNRGYLHPPDYFNKMPIDDDGVSRDPSWVVPSTFIPIPIGGMINVRGTGPNGNMTELEPKLQTIANFLPGGYKYRWGFNLWYGEWIPVPHESHLANISNLVRDAEEIGTLKDCLSGRPTPSVLSDFDSGSTYLLDPRNIQVQTGQTHFHLIPDRTRVRNANDPVGGVSLSREPSSSAQTYDLIIDQTDNSIQIVREGNDFGVQDIQYGNKDLLRLFYSNLVNCYPSTARNSTQSPLSINLKFYDFERDRYAIPTVRLRTQGLSLEGRLFDQDIQKMIHKCQNAGTYEDHFWRLVYRLLWRETFLKHSISGFNLDFSFDCIRILKALKFLDYQSNLSLGLSLECITEKQMTDLFRLCQDICSDFNFNLFSGTNAISSLPMNWNNLRDRILIEARSKLKMEIAESFSKSLAMAISRDVANKTNINLDLIKTSTDVYKSSSENCYIFNTCIYDNIEGGNGTTNSYVDKIGQVISLETIFNEQIHCDTACDEKAILNLLKDVSFNADTLYAFVKMSGGLQRQKLSEQAIFKIHRLISSPAITAFYQGVAECYAELKTILKREPGEEELACYLKKRPIADPRGNQLFEKFKTQSGGISELVPRISEIMPLCHGSCPDCLGDSRMSFEKGEKVIADRYLLGDLI
ncbi:MAG: DEAD/DEAH box helicase [Planctomycetes bacterium]|nr:DEAD/DEAH box helicase [Planctomycetota bacterium]